MLNFSKGIVFVLAVALVAIPASSFAGSSWSAVTVNQSQNAVSMNHGMDLHQGADIKTSTWLGNQASATSHVKGNQTNWFMGKGAQTQELSSGVGLTWE